MKRTHVGLLAGVLIFGTALIGAGWWAVRGISHLADEATDAAVGSVQGVVKSARSETDDAAKLVRSQAGGVVARVGDAPAALHQVEASASQEASSDPTSLKSQKAQAGSQIADAKQTEASDFEDFKKMLGPLLEDNDSDTPDIGNLLSGDKSGPDDWLAAIPGGKSETIRQWRQGKYKGKEDQALEDAADDPQVWRLVYFLSGGF